jgi:undecaprenyl-diphosphatase
MTEVAATSLRDVLLLGLVRGLTELLPLSFNGHLALDRFLFHARRPEFDLMAGLDLGTLAAVLLVLRRQVRAVLSDAFSALRPPSVVGTQHVPGDALSVVACAGPAAAVAFLLRPIGLAVESMPVAVALGFLATGALVVSVRWCPRGIGIQPTLLQALVIGLAQGTSVLPGTSRTAITVALVLWFGLRPGRAFEVAMLLSLPMMAATLLFDVWRVQGLSASPLALTAGATVALLSGTVALHVLRHSLVRGFFPMFASWVVPLGLSTMALAWAWPARP